MLAVSALALDEQPQPHRVIESSWSTGVCLVVVIFLTVSLQIVYYFVRKGFGWVFN